MDANTGQPASRPRRRVSSWTVGCIVAAVGAIGCCTITGVGCAIALPRMRASQAKYDAFRARAELNMMASAIKAYKADHGAFPPHADLPMDTLLNDTPSMFTDVPVPFPRHVYPYSAMTLTTPVAYLASYPSDPFRRRDPQVGYAYYTLGPGWIAYSPGPDLEYNLLFPPQLFNEADGSLIPQSWVPFEYDASNGTFSRGDILHVSAW